MSKGGVDVYVPVFVSFIYDVVSMYRVFNCAFVVHICMHSTVTEHINFILSAHIP